MTESDWKNVYPYFKSDSKTDNWGDPEKLSKELVYGLYDFRVLVGRPVIVHCAWEERNSGEHPKGTAADIHVVDMNIISQFCYASRFRVFKGIGVYPDWNNPGLHLDTRNTETRKQWGCIGSGENKKYVALDDAFFNQIMRR